MAYIGNPPISAAFLTDQFNGTGSATVFTLSVAPANTSSILVAVTGVLQDPSTYAVAGTTLTFSQAPPAGTGNISVRYLGIPASGVTTTAYRTVTEFTATAGQTLFNVPSYTVGFINVFRNGVRLGAADFTATSGTTVVLVNACTAGDLVVTESFFVSSVLNAIPATNGAVNNAYIADNAITTAKINPGAVIPADLSTGGPSWDTSGNLSFNSGFGSNGVAYAARAWVNFNGTGTVAIRASGNVSSITDNGTGDYTVNFTTAMPDANYVTSFSAGTITSATGGYFSQIAAGASGSTYSTTAVKVDVRNTGGSYQDTDLCCVAIFR